MLEAITYQDMLRNIAENDVKEDIIGILITRPELEVGKGILASLNYYHHLSGKNTNFYLPGYGAYWYGTYSDGRVVTKINGTEWSFSDQMFIQFIDELETYSSWKYSGESELLILEYKNGRLLFENVIRLQLDDMIRDKVILSTESFFQEFFRICKTKRSLDTISNKLGLDKGFDMIGEALLDILPNKVRKFYVQERYFCVDNCSPK